MSSSDSLMQAALNRLKVRVKDGLVDVAGLASDLPARLRTEWELFQEEVLAEAERLDQDNQGDITDEMASNVKQTADNPDEYIDSLRAKIADISKKLEANN